MNGNWNLAGWSVEKLASLVNVVYGKSPAEIKKLDDGIPIFGTGGVIGYTSEALCNGPSVILGRKGTIDKVQRSAGPFWAIDTTYYTTPKRDFDWSWLYYVISSFDLRKLNEASGVPSLSRSSLESLDVATPPLPEQQKIAAILTAVDDKLDVIARQIEATQTLKRGLMQTLFSRGIGNRDVDGRWSRHTAFVKVGTAKYPASWRMERMGEIAPLVRRAVDVRPGQSYPELGLRSFGKGTFHKPALTAEQVGNKRLFLIKADDLLLSNVFAWEGAIAVASPADDGRYGSHRYITCKVDPNIANAHFVARYLVTPAGLTSIGLASPGGAGRNKTLGLAALADIRIPLPSLAEQNAINQVLACVEKKISVFQAKQALYRDAKRGLMQKLLTGQWRVKPDNPGTPSPVAEAA